MVTTPVTKPVTVPPIVNVFVEQVTATLAMFVEHLDRLRVPIVVLPGNHDPALPDSVFVRGGLGSSLTWMILCAALIVVVFKATIRSAMEESSIRSGKARPKGFATWRPKKVGVLGAEVHVEVGERAALEQRHHREHDVLCCAVVEDGADVRVHELRRRFCLAPESLDEFIVLHELGSNNLDSHWPFGAQVRR